MKTSISLARSTLIKETRRFIPAILAVGFSGLLFLVQAGLLLGIFGTISVIVDHSRADLWITSSNTPSFDLARLFSTRHEMTLSLNPAIDQIEPMLVGMASWRGSDGSQIMVTIIGVNLLPNSLGIPDTFSPKLRNSLTEPDSVVVDIADVKKLSANIGNTAEVNDKAIRIVGITSGYRSIGGAYIFTSLETARRLLNFSINETSYLLASIHPPQNSIEIRDSLWTSANKTPYKVWTTHDFSIASQTYWLFESGAGASFGFSSMLGFIIGLVVTAQTLKAAVQTSLKEFATLRALGVSARSLSKIVIEQSFWVGLMGMLVAGIGTIIIWQLAELFYVNVRFPLWTIIGALILMLVVACLSGLLAIRPLFKAEPAELLR